MDITSDFQAEFIKHYFQVCKPLNALNHSFFSYAGPVGAFRGDRIRCTVMFGEGKKAKDGKTQVPICFTLNGRKILIKATSAKEEDDRVFMDYDSDKPLHPYIGMTEGCSVVAKVNISEKQY